MFDIKSLAVEILNNINKQSIFLRYHNNILNLVVTMLF